MLFYFMVMNLCSTQVIALYVWRIEWLYKGATWYYWYAPRVIFSMQIELLKKKCIRFSQCFATARFPHFPFILKKAPCVSHCGRFCHSRQTPGSTSMFIMVHVTLPIIPFCSLHTLGPVMLITWAPTAPHNPAWLSSRYEVIFTRCHFTLREIITHL